MKNLLWITPNGQIEFKVNWLERKILERIIKEKRAKLSMIGNELRGNTFKTIFVDEFANLGMNHKSFKPLKKSKKVTKI